MSETLAKLADWVRHPDSSATLLPHLNPSGGPSGGIENALQIDLGATSALQRLAYTNVKLGNLRGVGRFSASARFDGSALRSRVGVLTRWNPARLASFDAGYMAEIAWEARSVSDGACDSGTPTKIQSLTASFTATDVNTAITLVGAGPGGAAYVGIVTACDSSTQVTVSPAITTTVVAGMMQIGTFSATLRRGPDESGEVFFRKFLNPAFGFLPLRWMEVGLILTVDTVGDLKIRVVVRPNTQKSVTTGYATFGIDSDTWYTVDTDFVIRSAARAFGSAGWQVLSRAGKLSDGTIPSLRIGNFRAVVESSPPFILLNTIITM